MGLENDSTNKHEISIEHYIQDECSICREERQYAVFLYNILKKYKRKGQDERINRIFDACNIPQKAEIQNVFYEATFMRDFFERNLCIELDKDPKKISLKNIPRSKRNIEKKERSFNYKLIEYVLEKAEIEQKQVQSILYTYTHEEVNLGHNEFSIKGGVLSEEEIKEIKSEIQYMMNAKPDIAVIYMEEKTKKLLFLECKFESKESFYGSKKTKKVRRSQREIQWKIADFLCNNYLKREGIGLSDSMKGKTSCMVQFVREEPTEPNKNKIEIKDLIELNDEIFA